MASLVSHDNLLDINPDLDLDALAAEFARSGRVQIREVLQPGSAQALHDLLAAATAWGLAFKGADEPPAMLRERDLSALPADQREAIDAKIHAAAAAGEYSVRFGQYPMLTAYLERWSPGSPHDRVLELINSQPFLALARKVTGIPGLIKADAQATAYFPGDFLGLHTDSHVGQGWRVAYVLNLAVPDWQPDWGGYLNFFDENGDIVAGWKPRFNALNLLKVPQPHSVGYVPPFAPPGRYAITGWLRDR
jgi:Rps23 Pro-64 3,4-dihydroxylase Tpa1-like proline 4-hydroxylase